jgi:hypothetical protein
MQAHRHSEEELQQAVRFVEDEVRRLDPAVEVRIQPYRWHDDDLLDVDLIKGREEIHLEVSCDRCLEHSTLEPLALEHDLEEAIHDLDHRLAGAGRPRR